MFAHCVHMFRDLKKSRACVIILVNWGAKCYFVSLDRDLIKDDITATTSSDSAKGCHAVLWPEHTPVWAPGLAGPRCRLSDVPPVCDFGAMNRRWRMLSAVSWALARVAHVSTDTTQYSRLASLHRQHIRVVMETGTSTTTAALTSIGCVFQTNSDVVLSLSLSLSLPLPAYLYLSFFPNRWPAPFASSSFLISSFLFPSISFFLFFCFFVFLSPVYVTYDAQRGTGGSRVSSWGLYIHELSCHCRSHCSNEKYRNTPTDQIVFMQGLGHPVSFGYWVKCVFECVCVCVCLLHWCVNGKHQSFLRSSKNMRVRHVSLLL